MSALSFLPGRRRAAVLCSPVTFVFGVLLFLGEVARIIRGLPVVLVIEWVAFGFFALWIVLPGIGLARSP